jgi:hypothetical protein
LKKKLVTRAVFCGFIAFSFLLITFSSCTKDSDKTTKDEKTNGDVLEITEFTETNEDLLSVDYNYFYNELSPHGEWIEVSAKDLGLDIKPGSSSNTNFSDEKFITDLLGIKTARAQTSEDLINIFVWRPAIELASQMIKGNENQEYTPYNNGQWVNTDAGWYFQANTPQEDLTSHYGRWAQDPNLGWVWVPGKVWSPAWVEWRENDDYVAWAPIPPGTYIQNDAVIVNTFNENRFTVVEKRFFIEPSVYKYRYQYVENKNKIMIKEMTKTDGIMIKNKTVINKGPEVSVIEEKSGKKIAQVKIKKTGKKDETGYAQDVISVYTPEFKKEAEVKKEPVSKPEKCVSYKDAKKITKEEKEELKEKDKLEKKEEKELKKEEKEKNSKDLEKEKGNKKLGDDRGMKNEDKLKEYNEKEKEKEKVKGKK